MAAAAATVVLGSAAAYAITLPELPIKLPGISLEVPVDLPNPLISPPDTQLPANPIVGPPDGDELSELTGILDSAATSGEGRRAKPAAKPVARGAETAPAPAAARSAAPQSAAPDEAAARTKVPSSLADLFPDEDWEHLVDPNTSIVIGRGLNVCNNNNVKVIIERDSTDDENTVEQHNSNGDIVTSVDGQHTEPSESGISCHD